MDNKRIRYSDESGLPIEEFDAAVRAGRIVEQLYTTNKPMPELAENQIAVYLDDGGDVPRLGAKGAWVIKPDYRGVVHWDTDGVEHTITEVGVALPDGALFEKPPAAFEREFKDAKKAASGDVVSFAEYARNRIARNPSTLEAIGWASKEARALRVTEAIATGVDPRDADIKKLMLEATKRGKGETPQQLAELQLAKAGALGDAVAIIDGTVSDTLLKIEHAPDVAALTEIGAGLKELRAKVEAAQTQTQLAELLQSLMQPDNGAAAEPETTDGGA